MSTTDEKGVDTTDTPDDQDTELVTDAGKKPGQDHIRDASKLTEGDDQADKLTEAEAKADKYARALFDARVAATGRLADPTDLPFDAELLDNADALTAAIDVLIEAKPHLASRKPAWGDVGAGQTKAVNASPTFSDLFAQ